MSILKYSTKYFLLGGLALVVVICIVGFVYSQIQKQQLREIAKREHVDTFMREPADKIVQPPPRERTSHNLWGKSLVKSPVPKQSNLYRPDNPHDHLHLEGPPPSRRPSDLKKRLQHVNANGNSYYTNPNYFQEVYDAVSNGQDMATTIEILKEYCIFTDVVLEHMDSYEAFQYILNSSIPVDLKAPSIFTGPDIRYAKRVISEDPSSAEALEAGLYIGRLLKDPHEAATFLRGAIKYHPDSAMALFRLGDLFAYDSPTDAIPYLKKAAQIDPSIGGTRGGNYALGIAYQRLGDYKTAWVHFKKSIALNPYNQYSRRHLTAISNGEPILSPIVREPVSGSIPTGKSDSQHLPLWLPVDDPEAFAEAFPIPVDVPASPQPSESLSPTDITRQESEHAAFLDMLREQERLAQEAYYKELDDFINWAESIMTDAPIDTNNFLAKEMERHLLGKSTTFEPDRITRGFDLIQKYGQEDGIKMLEKDDPALAKQVQQQLNQKSDRPTPPILPNNDK